MGSPPRLGYKAAGTHAGVHETSGKAGPQQRPAEKQKVGITNVGLICITADEVKIVLNYEAGTFVMSNCLNTISVIVTLLYQQMFNCI